MSPFFYDLMSQLEATSLNVGEEEMKIIARKIMKARVPREALQIASASNGDAYSAKETSY